MNCKGTLQYIKDWQIGRLPHTPRGGGYIVYVLECGHRLYTKKSAYKGQKKMKCKGQP